MPRCQLHQEHLPTVSAKKLRECHSIISPSHHNHAANHCGYKMPPQKRCRVDEQFGFIASLKHNAALKTLCPPILQCNSTNKACRRQKAMVRLKNDVRRVTTTPKSTNELELRVGRCQTCPVPILFYIYTSCAVLCVN